MHAPIVAHRAVRAPARGMIGPMDPQESLIPTDSRFVTDRVRAVGGVPWRRLLRYLRPHAGPFSVAIVGLLIGSGLGLLVPLVIAGLVTEVVAGGDSAGLDRLIVGMLFLFLAQSLGGLVQSYYLGVVGERIVAQLRGELFASLVSLSLDFHGRHRVGELVSRLSSDVTLIRTMLTQTTTSLLSSLIGLIGSILILFTLSPTLLLVALLLAPALLAVAIVFGRPLQRVSTQVQDTIAHSTATAEEALSGIRVVKSYVREDYENQRYAGDLAGVVASGSRLALWRALFGALMGFLGFGAIAVLLWYTGHEVIEGRLSIGTLTGFLLYGVTIGASLATIAGLYGQLREGTGAVQRVFEIIDTQPTVVDAPDAVDLGPVTGRIELDGVSFAYDGERHVVRDLDLHVPAGEVLAVVGPSGSGKTTLVGLIPRLWDVSRGTIRVDGTDIRDVTTGSLRAQIGLVPQEATLFGGTIAENIRYGRLDATDAELEAAARAANAHDFITALEAGYASPVGDRGQRLSGGQRQRIAIARAFLADPRILLLDDATSSVDATTETAIKSGLREAMEGRTTFVIAHRLSTVSLADEVIVMDGGSIVDRGTHEELLEGCGFYREIAEHGLADSVFLQRDLEEREGMARL
jgi:ATP-binding cassette, subfamily B, bacterial MsbA